MIKKLFFVSFCLVGLNNNAADSTNIAIGLQALEDNIVGLNNIAVGWQALMNVTGNNNIGIGSTAGVNVIAGNDNIFIGNPGLVGDTGIIRIGEVGVHTAFIIPVNTMVASVYKTAVYVGSNFITPNAGPTTSTIPFDTEIFDSNNNFNTVAYEYTVPVTGSYSIDVNVSLIQADNANQRSLLIAVNGFAVTGYGVTWATGAGENSPKTFSGIINVVAGDLITVQYVNDTAADTILANYSSLHIRFLTL